MDKPCNSVSGTIAARLFFRGSDAGSRARQNFFTGQIWQRGLFAVQIRVPRSIIVFWKSRALFWGTSFTESFHNSCRPWVESIGARILKRRVRARAVLASTMGRDLLNAKTAMAFAVYRPIPGKTATRRDHLEISRPIFRRWCWRNGEDFALAHNNRGLPRRAEPPIQSRRQASGWWETGSATYYSKG